MPWFSPLFENTFDGGVLLALPYELAGEWDGTGDEYEQVIDKPDQFLFWPIGSGAGLFVGDFDGTGTAEAHWMRLDPSSPLTLVVWSEWDDPARSTLPESKAKVARAWRRRQDPRQAWLEERLRGDVLAWERHETRMRIADGVLLLLHGEGRAWQARLAKPSAVARCGQAVPAGLEPGGYRVETLVIDELHEGAHLCGLCRWVKDPA